MERQVPQNLGGGVARRNVDNELLPRHDDLATRRGAGRGPEEDRNEAQLVGIKVADGKAVTRDLCRIEKTTVLGPIVVDERTVVVQAHAGS